MKNKVLSLLLLSALNMITSCSDFLDEKSDTMLSTPETLEDNQALLDRTYNVTANNSISGEISSDDIYILDSDYNTLSNEFEKRLYTWQPDHVSNNDENDWGSCYRRINVCNTVLFNIDHYKISGAENLKGQALALRAAIYLEAAQIYSPVYNKGAASSDLGLPLRLSPDMNIASVRTSVENTYKQILKDLHEAVDLLPEKQVSVIRPSKVTALGYLSRVYLYMGDYGNSLKYGNKALEYNGTLMDFNTLNPLDSYPVKSMNPEVLLHTYMVYSPLLSSSIAKIPKELYDSYSSNDLRKSIYFRKNTNQDVLFKGNYGGNSSRMTCMAVDEIYLTTAESYARLGDVDNAMKLLNGLLIKRWKTGTFVPFVVNGKDEALALIAKERRKELLFRGLRWADLKRYNRDGAHITLTRTVANKVYTLAPNDPRYAIAIPEDIIKMTDMPQNPR